MQIRILFHIVINKRCISTGDQDYLTIIIIISVQHLYLDDANEMNGSLNIYPGTHKILGNPNQNYVEKYNLRKKILNVEKYNILILNVYTWHFGGKNIDGKEGELFFKL